MKSVEEMLENGMACIQADVAASRFLLSMTALDPCEQVDMQDISILGLLDDDELRTSQIWWLTCHSSQLEMYF
jgi:hypothetical protein